MSQHSIAYQRARQGAAVLDRSSRGRMLVSGPDRATYLQGLLTNDIVALKPGTGCYAAYLTAQGRMIADLWVYEVGDVILVTLDHDVTRTVLAKFDQFIFAEDVQLGDVTDAFAQVAVVGPLAAETIAAATGAIAAEALTALPLHGNRRVATGGSPIVVTRIADTGEPGFDLYVERAQLEAMRSALREAGAADLDEQTAETLRIEGGVPRFHRDMDEETIPLEAGIEGQAISFSKGCYVGQEVIIRVLHRGHGRVARKLAGLVLEGPDVPARSAAVSAADRAIGEVTSATWSPALNAPIALAFLHRDFLEAGTKVAVAGQPATVTALPFVTPPAIPSSE